MLRNYAFRHTLQVYLLIVYDCHEFGQLARYIVTRQRNEKARNRSSFPGKNKWLISSPKFPYQLWGPPNLLCK